MEIIMSKFKQVTIVAGTHGNEFTGIYLLRKWLKTESIIRRNSFKTTTYFANIEAYSNNKRYIEHDLNRQFLLSDLSNINLTSYEQRKAKVINEQLGPKGNSKTDLIIDLHNTTSNMGPTLILMKEDPFNTQLAAYIKIKVKNITILMEDQCSYLQHPFLCTIANQGVIVEIGPQAQSVLRHDILESMEDITCHILDFIELYNENNLPQLPKNITVFKFLDTLSLPVDEQGNICGVVHRHIQDSDFTLLKNGDPIFHLFDGNDIYWEGDDAYPHFINEAAYYDNKLAFSLANKVTIDVLF